MHGPLLPRWGVTQKCLPGAMSFNVRMGSRMFLRYLTETSGISEMPQPGAIPGHTLLSCGCLPSTLAFLMILSLRSSYSTLWKGQRDFYPFKSFALSQRL